MFKLLEGGWYNKKIYLLGLSFLVLFFIIGSYSYYQTQKLTIDFFDIGQGDSALIIIPTGQAILIDGGPDNTVLRRIGASIPFYRRRIDLVIFTHYHKDHITGLIEVLKRYKVKRIIYAPSPFDSPTLEALRQIVQKRKIATSLIIARAQLNFTTNCFLNFLNPRILGVRRDQNNSLLVRLTCHGKKFLFTGDNNSGVERALLNSSWDLSAQVLKIAHHGSKSASSEVFLRAVNPYLAIISVGRDNRFGLPNLIILRRLIKLGIKFKRTDQSGSLKIVIP